MFAAAESLLSLSPLPDPGLRIQNALTAPPVSTHFSSEGGYAKKARRNVALLLSVRFSCRGKALLVSCGYFSEVFGVGSGEVPGAFHGYRGSELHEPAE